MIVQLVPDEATVSTATAQIPIRLLFALKVIALASTFVPGMVHWLVPASQRINKRLDAFPLALLRSSAVYFTVTVAFLANRPVRPSILKALPVRVKPVVAAGN